MSQSIHAITMPRWGMTMSEGTLAAWLAGEGDVVAKGQDLMEIETTKITNVVESLADGVLRRRLAAPGTVAPVGALVGIIAGPEVMDREIDAFIAARQGARDQGTVAADAADAGRLITIGPHSLHVVQAGSGNGIPMVFLHGFGSDSAIWALNQEALAQGRATLAFDLPAHGRSAPSVPGGDPAEMAAAIGQALGEIGVGRAHLVAHSFGAAVAMSMAERSLGLAASLTLIAPVGFGAEISSAFLDGFLAAERRKPMKDVLAMLFADPAAMGSAMPDAVLRMKRLDGVAESLAAIAARLAEDGRQRLDLRPRLAALTLPVLVVWGEKDAIVSASQASGLPAQIGSCMIAHAGHLPMVEAAAQVNRLIADHIARAEASS